MATTQRVRAQVLEAEAAIRRTWRASLVRRASDVTSQVAHRSCLVVAPHPDDETIGSGATIARKRATGTPVKVLVVADGRSSHRSSVVGPDELAAIRAAELLEACRRLGVEASDVVQLGLHDGTVAAQTARVAAAIASLVEEMAPDEVRVPTGRDWHADHKAVRVAAGAALDASPGPQVLEYPVWYWMHGPWEADPFGPWPRRRPGPLLTGLFDRASWPRTEVVSTAGYLGTKHHALLAHRSQVTNLTGEPGWAVLDDEFVAAFLGPQEIAFAAHRRS